MSSSNRSGRWNNNNDHRSENSGSDNQGSQNNLRTVSNDVLAGVRDSNDHDIVMFRQGAIQQGGFMVDGIRMSVDEYQQWMRENPPPVGVFDHYPGQNFVVTNSGLVNFQTQTTYSGPVQTGGNPQTITTYLVNGQNLSEDSFKQLVSADAVGSVVPQTQGDGVKNEIKNQTDGLTSALSSGTFVMTDAVLAQYGKVDEIREYLYGVADGSIKVSESGSESGGGVLNQFLTGVASGAISLAEEKIAAAVISGGVSGLIHKGSMSDIGDGSLGSTFVQGAVSGGVAVTVNGGGAINGAVVAGAVASGVVISGNQLNGGDVIHKGSMSDIGDGSLGSTLAQGAVSERFSVAVNGSGGIGRYDPRSQPADFSNYPIPTDNQLISAVVENRTQNQVDNGAIGVSLIVKDNIDYLTDLTHSAEGRATLKNAGIDVSNLSPDALRSAIDDFATKQVQEGFDSNPIVMAQAGLVIGQDFQNAGHTKHGYDQSGPEATAYIQSGTVAAIVNNVQAGFHVITEGFANNLHVKNDDHLVAAIVDINQTAEYLLGVKENLDAGDLGNIAHGAGFWVSDSRFQDKDNSQEVIEYIAQHTDDAVNIAQGTSFASQVFGYDATNEAIQTAEANGDTSQVMEIARGLDAYQEHLISSGMTEDEAIKTAQDYVKDNSETWQEDLENWMNSNKGSGG